MQLLAGTYYIVTEDHLRFATGLHIAYKRLLNVYTFRLHAFTKFTDRRIPTSKPKKSILFALQNTK